MRVSRTVMWLAGAVAVLPTLCVVGFALVGRALDTMEVAQGELRSPEALVEMHRRFMAMTPAQHLTEARSQLQRFDAVPGHAQDLARIVSHLDRIPAAAPEHPAAAALRERVAAHRRAALPRAIETVRRVATHAPPGPEGHSTRCAMFSACRAEGGLDVITPGPPHDETLVLNVADCDARALRALTTLRDPLQRMNVHRVRCAVGGVELLVEDL